MIHRVREANHQRGIFLSLEGPEGCGKSTQAGLLKTWLEERGKTVVLTREPGGTPTGEKIREILQHHASGEPIAVPAELLLFAASRAQLVANVIRPALDRGEWVLCDRYIDSSLAYQGYGRETSVRDLLNLNEFAVGGLWPERTLFFNLSVEEAFARVHSREGELDRFEAEEKQFHQRVLDGYQQLASRFEDRYRTIDASQSIEDVFAQVKETVGRFL